MSHRTDFQPTDGEQGFIADPATIKRHVDNLMRTHGVWDRRAYLDGVAAKEGNEAARRVKDAFGKAWAMRQEGAR